MTNMISFSPLMRRSVGFDRLHDLLSMVDGPEAQTDSYPPYNIEKLGDDKYRIVMAVAGFTLNDLTITAQGETVVISGRIDDKADDEVNYLHRGIAARAFQRSFRLADHIKVTGAEMRDGLLTVQLVREVPEEAKPRLIQIKPAGAVSEGKTTLN